MTLASDEVAVGNNDGTYTYDNPAEIEQNDLIILGDPHDDYKPRIWVTVEHGYPGRLWFSSYGLSFWVESRADLKILNNPYCRVFCTNKRETINVNFKDADLVFLSGNRPATPAGFYRENDDRDGQLISYFDGKGHYRYYDPLTKSLSEQEFAERSTPPRVGATPLTPLRIDFTEEGK